MKGELKVTPRLSFVITIRCSIHSNLHTRLNISVVSHLIILYYTQLRDIRRKLVETEQGQDDQELTYEETVGDLKSLIIYAKSVSIKPWNWRKQKATPVTQMFSFGEPTAIQLCSKFPRGE